MPTMRDAAADAIAPLLQHLPLETTAKCPTGLGHLASGRESVRVIALQFVAKTADKYWLHVEWEILTQPGIVD